MIKIIGEVLVLICFYFILKFFSDFSNDGAFIFLLIFILFFSILYPAAFSKEKRVYIFEDGIFLGLYRINLKDFYSKTEKILRKLEKHEE